MAVNDTVMWESLFHELEFANSNPWQWEGVTAGAKL
jgi:hypothetical protein